MQVQFDIPDDLALKFSNNEEGLTRALLEALAVDGYHTRRLSESQAARLLGFGFRLAFHGTLKAHDVYLNYDLKELEKDIATLERLDRGM